MLSCQGCLRNTTHTFETHGFAHKVCVPARQGVEPGGPLIEAPLGALPSHY